MNEIENTHPYTVLSELVEEGTNSGPRIFAEYIGQEELKKKLTLYTQAAKERNEPLDHTLLFGPPGLGKTTLAHIIARELAVPIKLCSGPLLERSGDLVAILSSLEHKEVLFIDEIHRLPAAVEEVLYTALEEFRIDVILGKGAGAKSISLPISPFTLIGATTMSGKISSPLRTRFGITERLEFYTEHELQQIILHTALTLGVTITEQGAYALACASRGTPRVAKKLLRRVRDVAQVQKREATPEFVHDVLRLLGLTKEGLSAQDLNLLSIILTNFNGGPVGIETLGAMISEDVETIERVYEPFLMRLGLLEKTARGRQIPPQSRTIVEKLRAKN